MMISWIVTKHLTERVDIQQTSFLNLSDTLDELTVYYQQILILKIIQVIPYTNYMIVIYFEIE